MVVHGARLLAMHPPVAAPKMSMHRGEGEWRTLGRSSRRPQLPLLPLDTGAVAEGAHLSRKAGCTNSSSASSSSRRRAMATACEKHPAREGRHWHRSGGGAVDMRRSVDGGCRWSQAATQVHACILYCPSAPLSRPSAVRLPSCCTALVLYSQRPKVPQLDVNNTISHPAPSLPSTRLMAVSQIIRSGDVLLLCYCQSTAQHYSTTLQTLVNPAAPTLTAQLMAGAPVASSGMWLLLRAFQAILAL